MKKKILCLVLAIAMMLSLSAMVGAVNYNSETGLYTTETEISIKKTYTLEGSGTSPEETFYLVQIESEVDETSEADSAPALVTVKDTDGTTDLTKTVETTSYPVVGSVSYSAGGAKANATTENITVTLPSYEHTGVYTYTLVEVDNGTAGVTYFDGKIYLVVTVIEQNGQVVVAAVHAETDWDGTANNEGKTDTIENTYTASSLTVSKTVSGNLGDKTKEFTFTVTFAADADVSWTPDITVTTEDTDNTATGNAAFTTATSSTNETTGVTTYTYTFTLTNGDSVTFGNIPEGVTYTVGEDSYENDGYTTTVSGTENGTMAGEDVTVAYTNTKTGEVDTGVILESMPYVMILAVVVVGGIALISKKKVSE